MLEVPRAINRGRENAASFDLPSAASGLTSEAFRWIVVVVTNRGESTWILHRMNGSPRDASQKNPEGADGRPKVV